MIYKKVFENLKNLHVSKVYVMFSYEKEIEIISNIVVMDDNSYSVDWNNEIYEEKSYITKPIFDYNKKDFNYIDGLLTWDVAKEKIIISGERFKIKKEKFSQEI